MERNMERNIRESLEKGVAVHPVSNGILQFDQKTGILLECDPYVTRAVIPDHIKNVPVAAIIDGAFQNCTALRSVCIPRSVTRINSYAFYRCFSLTDVFYDGTREEFEANLLPNIDKRANDCFLNANFHFKRVLPGGLSVREPTRRHVALILLATLSLTALILGRGKDNSHSR